MPTKAIITVCSLILCSPFIGGLLNELFAYPPTQPPPRLIHQGELHRRVIKHDGDLFIEVSGGEFDEHCAGFVFSHEFVLRTNGIFIKPDRLALIFLRRQDRDKRIAEMQKEEAEPSEATPIEDDPPVGEGDAEPETADEVGFEEAGALRSARSAAAKADIATTKMNVLLDRVLGYLDRFERAGVLMRLQMAPPPSPGVPLKQVIPKKIGG